MLISSPVCHPPRQIAAQAQSPKLNAWGIFLGRIVPLFCLFTGCLFLGNSRSTFADQHWAKWAMTDDLRVSPCLFNPLMGSRMSVPKKVCSAGWGNDPAEIVGKYKVNSHYFGHRTNSLMSWSDPELYAPEHGTFLLKRSGIGAAKKVLRLTLRRCYSQRGWCSTRACGKVVP